MTTTTGNKPTTDVIDTLDRATCVSMQLESLLAHTYGNSRETFSNLNDDLRDSYLWLCCDLASELKGLIDSLTLAGVSVRQEATT